MQVALADSPCPGPPMPEVLFDNQIFVQQRRGGISRYFVELMRLLPTTSPQFRAPFPSSWTLNEHAADARLARPVPGRHALDGSHLVQKFARVAAQRLVASRAALRHPPRSSGSVYHPTYYSKAQFVGWRGPVVVTVHDMIPEIFPHLFPRNPHRDKRWYLRRADAIIAVSQSTANDVRRLFPDVTAPITVIPLAVSHETFRPDGPHVTKFPRPWILFVGKRSNYKDFDVLLRAVAISSSFPIHVVVAGGSRPTTEEDEVIQQLKLSNHVSFVRPNDAELSSLYRSADAFVFPSRYEGFGLPTLEAMASGAPVILARASAHPEVGGEAALYFTPKSAEELAARLDHALSSAKVQSDLRETSLRQSRKFDWVDTAGATARVYQELLG